MRMRDETVLKKALKGDTEGRRTIGSPRGRWLEGANQKYEIENWGGGGHVMRMEDETVL